MANEGIKFEGLEEIKKRLNTVKDAERFQKGLKEAVLIVERAAKQKAPKGEGDLRRSITSEVNGLTGRVYTPLYYAPYVEFGTGKEAEGGKGRQEVPWVYVEGNVSEDRAKSKKVYTDKEADETVAYLRSKGLPAFKTSGQKPVPFLRPALFENREEILRILRESVFND